eukprot:4420985-Prymnesium_polylepis.2
MKARDSTLAYSLSEESQRNERSSRSSAVVVGGSAIEFKSNTSHVHVEKMVDEVGPTRTKAMK